MAIQLNPEQEQIVGQAIQAGLIQAADDVVAEGVAAIRKRLDARNVPGGSQDSEEWSRRLDTWIEGHSATVPLLSDDAMSRESIYGTRGN
jgi:hypothetical protein